MTSRRSLVCTVPVIVCALGCGGSQPPRTPSVYTAEQLNTLASTPPMVDIPGVPPASPQQEPSSEPTSEPTPTPPAGHAHLRLLHASPDPALSHLAVYLDQATEPLIDPATYRHDTGYRDVLAGGHSVSVRAATAAPGDPATAMAHTPVLAADHPYTLVVYGRATGLPHAGISSAEDDTAQPEAGHARVRFFHAMEGAGAVDVCFRGGHVPPMFANVPYGSWGTHDPSGGYATVTTGHPIVFQFRAQNATPCTGRVLGTVTHTVDDRHVVTVVATGVAGAHSQDGSRQGMVCTDAPAPVGEGCVTVPIR